MAKLLKVILESTDLRVQGQDSIGNWLTYQFTQNSPSIYLAIMKDLKKVYPKIRFRVVDLNDRLIDML